LRMHDHEDVEIFVDLIGIFAKLAHRELVAHLGEDGPGRGRALSHHRIAEGTRHGKRADKPDYFLLWILEPGDEMRHVIFEEALAIRLEEGDNLLVVGAIGAGKAEIDLIAFVPEGN